MYSDLSTSGHHSRDSEWPLSTLVARRLKRRYPWLEMGDLLGYAALGLAGAAEQYQPDRGTDFRQYAILKASYLAVDEMRHAQVLRRRGRPGHRPTVSLGRCSGDGDGVQDPEDPTSDAAMRQLEARDFCAAVLRRLRKEERRLLMLYYFDKLTFREIAAVLSVSECAVCLRHKSMLARIRRYVAQTRKLP
jgi:RNA polymerase sigma factor (sigma-70 family)